MSKKMDLITVLINLSINLFAGILIFLLGLFWHCIPKSYRKFLLTRFWGKEVCGKDFVICYGTLMDSRLTQPNPPPYRYVKSYPDGRVVNLVGPWGNIVGDCEIRSVSYIINALSSYRKDAISVMDDKTAFKDINRTIIALGSPSSNQITDMILREPNNIFTEFGQDGSVSFIRDKITNRRFIGFQEPIKIDYAIVLKIPNLRFPKHFFFVCAGLGEWGTSGASWYLSTKWWDLNKEFGNAFGIVVEVDIESDGTARRVFPLREKDLE